MKTIMLLGTTAALALPAFGAAIAQEPGRAQCVPALTDGGFALTIRVEGEDGLFRLTCRDGSLVAVPADAVVGQALAPTADATSETAAEEIDASGEAAQSELGASEELAEPPTELSAAPDGDVSDKMASDEAPTAPDAETDAKDAGRSSRTALPPRKVRPAKRRPTPRRTARRPAPKPTMRIRVLPAPHRLRSTT